MAAPNVDNIYRSPGRLVANPTNLLLPYPHGGTELGIARDVLFKPNISVRELMAEEFRHPVEVLTTGVRPIIAGVMRTWDDAMMSNLFYATQQDSFGRVGLKHNAVTNRAGGRLTSKAISLLFSPTSVNVRKHILIYNAVPVVEETFEMKLSLAHELGIPFFFLGLPDSQGRTYVVDFRTNITL